MDSRGRTALLLAVCLDHYECAKLLLEEGASASVRRTWQGTEDPSENFVAWSAVHEATCTGDVQLLALVLQYRDFERQKLISSLDAKLLDQLKYVPDFYVEMKWEFTSWIPFVARLCPSDVCRIYKVSVISFLCTARLEITLNSGLEISLAGGFFVPQLLKIIDFIGIGF